MSREGSRYPDSRQTPAWSSDEHQKHRDADEHDRIAADVQGPL